MDPVLHSLLTDRLRTSGLSARAARIVEAACEAPAGGVTPAPVWLRSIRVEGFRGIGPAATLRLAPQPGLTVVVGRNGSGKSSFAEGLELLLTGALRRWAKRTKAWTSTWQCLHHDGPTRLGAELVTGGGTVALAQEWRRGAGHDDASGRAAVAAALAKHGWAGALASYRPFLSYAELATMFDTLTSLYDALSPVLGLADLDGVLARLGARRLALEKRAKAAKERELALLARLDPEDPREAAVVAGLRRRRRDLGALAALLHDAPPPAPRLPAEAEVRAAFAELAKARAAHEAAASTDARRATALAELLRQALALREGDDCPLCGTRGVLGDGWATEARRHACELDGRAAALCAAASAVAAAEARVGALLDAPVSDLDGTLAALRAARERAAAGNGDAAWRERVVEIGAWLAEARAVAAEAGELKALKAAEAWVKGVAGDLRAERFAPIAGRAIANWRELRQSSSVDLREIRLQKVGRGGRATFDVRADGEHANALGVMSQGELLALSVSVFLPRAALDESPFRFAVIDDPVQAMDPAKVDGLARVLHGAAAKRQLVVFTHDDRLPEALRRLRLPATVLQVERRARSAVTVRVSRTPARRHLDDAKRIVAGDLPDEVRARVVPTFCRSAVEAMAAEIVRRRAAQADADLALADERLRDARTLREALALALFDDRERAPDVAAALGADAAGLVDALNHGAHGHVPAGRVASLPARTERLLHVLAEVR